LSRKLIPLYGADFPAIIALAVALARRGIFTRHAKYYPLKKARLAKITRTAPLFLSVKARQNRTNFRAQPRL